MSCLLDTGILLRVADTADPLHLQVLQAVKRLQSGNTQLVTTTQNLAEFWNVATRPLANNGLGLSTHVAIKLLEQVVEPICEVLAEPSNVYAQLKQLGRRFDFGGKNVHDARLVAMILCCQIDSVLTLNPRHFQRFQAEGFTVLTPESVNA